MKRSNPFIFLGVATSLFGVVLGASFALRSRPAGPPLLHEHHATDLVSESPPEIPGGGRRIEEGPRKPDRAVRIRRPADDEVFAWIRSADRKSWWRALRALRGAEDPGLRLRMIRELAARADEDLAERAVAMIAAIGHPESSILAADLLASHPSGRVRGQAARELAQIRGGSVVPALQRAFASDGDLDVRTTAALELERLGMTGQRELLVIELSRRLDHRDPVVRKDAADRLGHVGGESVIAHLARALGDPDREVRRAAVGSLEETENPRAIPLLENAQGDADAVVGRRASEAIRRINEAVVGD